MDRDEHRDRDGGAGGEGDNMGKDRNASPKSLAKVCCELSPGFHHNYNICYKIWYMSG